MVKGVAPDLARRARQRLVEIDRARTPSDLGALPGRRLERLLGDRAGQLSVRVNAQWRICFTWRDGEAHDVWFGDHH